MYAKVTCLCMRVYMLTMHRSFISVSPHVSHPVHVHPKRVHCIQVYMYTYLYDLRSHGSAENGCNPQHHKRTHDVTDRGHRDAKQHGFMHTLVLRFVGLHTRVFCLCAHGIKTCMCICVCIISICMCVCIISTYMCVCIIHTHMCVCIISTCMCV